MLESVFANPYHQKAEDVIIIAERIGNCLIAVILSILDLLYIPVLIHELVASDGQALLGDVTAVIGVVIDVAGKEIDQPIRTLAVHGPVVDLVFMVLSLEVF